MSEDKQILDYLWDNWDSDELTVEKLISFKEKDLSDETLSEIWHLISLKSLKKTALHARNALIAGGNQAFIHDNLLFGHGFCNDFNRRDLNNLVSFYFDYLERMPVSVISMRCLIEILLENRRYREAGQWINEAKQRFLNEQDIWEIYSVWIIWSDGKKDLAKLKLEDLSNRNPDNYMTQLLVAEFYARVCEYDLALQKYKKSFISQRGKRKIDPLISQVKIHEILGNTEMALRVVKLIQEVYKSDYGIEDGSEIEIWKQKEEQLVRVIEIECD